LNAALTFDAGERYREDLHDCAFFDRKAALARLLRDIKTQHQADFSMTKG